MIRCFRGAMSPVLLSLVVAVAACGGDAEAPPTSDDTRRQEQEPGPVAEESFSYSGPGSYWEAHFDVPSSTFTITMAEMPNTPVLMTVEGTFAHVNGFKLLTVTSATGADAPAAGEQAVGLELPGYAFLLMPLDPNHDGIIPMLVSGGCPTTDQSLNWLIAQGYAGKDATETHRDFFGTYSYSIGTGTAYLPSRYALEGLTELTDPPQPIQPGACDGSVMTMLDADDNSPLADMWMTDGGAMVRTYDDGGSQTILALPGDAVAANDLAGSYVGFHFSSEDGEAPGEADSMTDSFPVTMTIDAAGQGTGAAYEDVTLGALVSDQVTVSLGDVNVPSDGWVTGHLGTPEGNGTLACAAATGVGTAGQNILFCIGQNPGDPTQAFTLMLASQ